MLPEVLPLPLLAEIDPPVDKEDAPPEMMIDEGLILGDECNFILPPKLLPSPTLRTISDVA